MNLRNGTLRTSDNAEFLKKASSLPGKARDKALGMLGKDTTSK